VTAPVLRAADAVACAGLSLGYGGSRVLTGLDLRRAGDGAAAVYATHDAAEALAIADQVAVLHSGALAQAGPPATIYAEPDDLTVARLTGPVSVLNAQARPDAPGTCTIELGDACVTVPAGCAPGADPTQPAILVRPDWARLGAAGCDGDLPGTLNVIRFRGPHTDYHIATPVGPLLIREPGPPRASRGPVRWSLLRARLMPRDPLCA
jgi:ABC-type Fe3+/spermidine/putrescine transport system ATPase subunit